MPRLHLRSTMPLLRVLLLVAAITLIPASAALASHSQVSIVEDDPNLQVDPAGTLAQMRLLGANQVRVAVRWQLIAPKPTSRKRPRHFNASDPADYPAASWGIFDAIVIQAKAQGITPNFDLLGGSPIWATGPGAPRDGRPHFNWSPNPKEFQQFAQAVATRYSGDYNPISNKFDPGNVNDLPRVSLWSVWNEPDYGPSLAPQGVLGNLKIENSPRMYRNLVDAAYTALKRTGHGHDRLMFGELAPRGAQTWGVFSGMKPLIFLRAMYCVGSHYRPLRGHEAAIRGCPTKAAGSRQFRARNPALFTAAGVADHPYMRWYPPNHEKFPDPNNTSLGQIGNLTRALDRLNRVYGSHKRFPIYNTEFGYITTPPKHDVKKTPWVGQAKAAYYLNWAEYISWRNPRIISFSQYLLYDPLPARADNDWGGFASGLLTFGKHKPKATYPAWRLPVYLPVTSARRGRSLEVWGCARPAPYARSDTGAANPVEIQFQRNSRGKFTTLRTVAITDPKGYFDIHMTFPGSGAVRLAWTYPSADQLLGYFDPLKPRTIFSRSQRISLR